MKDEIMDIPEDENRMNLWTPLKFEIDENYEYQPDGIFFRIFSDFLYYGIAFPILKIITKIVYDLKIEGKENLKKVEEGAVSISNHVLVLDCAMIGLAWGRRKVTYTTQEESFQIPFVRKLIKVLNAIPIPKGIRNRKFFIRAVDQMLKQGKVVHFYPESDLWPYCKKIRKFKNGAFDFSVKNQVPIVPMVFQFRDPKGIRKIFKRKLDVTLHILEPISFEKDNLEQQKKKIQERMQAVI